ncbi:uncharacterized protein LOC128675241 [Plodia interpunctella]|uniref:uncharacterized protein LOC128675241 n=1 Tax=Plodia interpunctella TaxID=58824 RepID=UPI002367FBA4|nr:uncharacterized protein LOC128675241 [Plodia interpunctella]
MVPTRTTRLSTTTGVCKGSIIGAGKIRSFSTLGNIFFNLCKACQAKTMAAIPPSAFTAGRIRETQRRDMQLTTNTKSKADTKFFNMAAFTELSPLKYNSKLMNSIWGFYNRYSPHNVKKVTEDFAFQAELQQSAVNSGNRAGPFTLPVCSRP